MKRIFETSLVDGVMKKLQEAQGMSTTIDGVMHRILNQIRFLQIFTKSKGPERIVANPIIMISIFSCGTIFQPSIVSLVRSTNEKGNDNDNLDRQTQRAYLQPIGIVHR